MPLVTFYTPCIKTSGFLIFSVGKEKSSGMKWIKIRFKDLLGHFTAFHEALQSSVKIIWSLNFRYIEIEDQFLLLLRLDTKGLIIYP